MALYEVVLRGTVHAQQWINRFYYASTDTGAPSGWDASELLDAVEAVVVPVIKGLTSGSGDWKFDDTIIRNLYDDTDFAENLGQNENGVIGSSQAMPPFVALAFRTTRMRTGKNRGYKRISGVPESRVSGNGITGLTTEVNNAAAVFSSGLPVGAPTPVDTAHPVVLFYDFKGIDPETLRREYGLFATEVLQRQNMHLYPNFSYYRLTTQRSRISGHGA